MFDEKSYLVRKALEAGTGAEISLKADKSGLQTSLQIWFTDLTRRRGPVISLGPSGLRRHRIVLRFGPASASVLQQIGQADSEARQLACALTKSIDPKVEVTVAEGMTRENWFVNGPDFFISAEKRYIDDVLDDEEIVRTCEEIIVPLMAAFAELIGYDEVAPDLIEHETETAEGAVSFSVMRRRERNPRNRLLAIRLHGHRCGICGVDPRETYGDNGQVIEVHHLVPLAHLDEPRVYDPVSDLVPLCPTCHRVVHTRRPIPWEPREVLEMMVDETV